MILTLNGRFPSLHHYAIPCMVCLMVITIFSSTPSAVVIEEIKLSKKLQPASTSAYDSFASSLAVSGDVLAIGTPQYDSFWEDSGAVYIYIKTKGHWRFSKKLQAKSPQEGGLFGYSIAIEGSILVVGEPGSTNKQKGSVHIFSRNIGGKNRWGYLRSLSRPDDCHLRIRDKFGDSVSVLKGRLLIGAPKACKSRENWGDTTGAVYLYENYGANYIKKLVAHNGDDFDYFGASVSLCGQFAFIGAPQADSGILRSDSGVTYVYKAGNNWKLHQYINPQNTGENDQFGSSMACTDNYIAIGAPATSSTYGEDVRKGSVYLYLKNKGGKDNWGLHQNLDESDYYNNDPDRNNLFGQTVSMRSDYLIVGYGESQKNNSDQEPGAQVFKLENEKWNPKKSILYSVDSTCSTSSLDTGFSVTTDGNTFVVGDVEDETSLDSCNRGIGSANIYTKYIEEISTLTSIYLLLGGN